MSEKNLNVRVGLKYDTFANWTNEEKQFILKKGEVAFATVAAEAGSGLTEPVVMAKIGNGEKTFNELDWDFYAKAADVHTWAKKSETEFVEWVNKQINFGSYYTKSQIDELLKAITDAAAALAERVLALEKAVDLLNDAETVEGSVAHSVKTAVDALADGQVKLNKEAIDLLNDAETVEGSVAHSVKTAVDALADGQVKLNKEAIDDINNTETGILKQAKDYTDALANGQVNTNKEAIEAINDETNGILAQAMAYSDSLEHENTEYGIEYDSVNKKIKLTSDTSKTEIDATDFIKDGMIETVELSEDGLNLVITWNTDSDKGDKTVTTIPLSGLVDVYTGVDGTTVKVEVSSDNKVSAEVKTGVITDGHIAADAAIAKSKLASDVQTSLGLADSAVQEEDIAKLREDSHTHSFIESELNKIKAGDVDKWNAAEQNAKNYADDQVEALADGAVKDNTDAIGTINETINSYGDVVTHNVAEFATKAQGDKADSAVQSVSSVAGNGIKATTVNNAVTIDWDPEVVFVFDCGDASTNV